MKRKIIFVLTSIFVVLLFLTSACAAKNDQIKSFGNEPEQEVMDAVIEEFPNKDIESLTKESYVKIYQLKYDICALDETAEIISKAKQLKDVLSEKYSWTVFFDRRTNIPVNTVMRDVVTCSKGEGITASEYEAACNHYGAEINEKLKAKFAESEDKWKADNMRLTAEIELKMLDKEEAYKLFKEKGVTPVKNGDEIVVASSVLLSGMKFICTQAEDGKEYVITDAPIWYGEYFKEGELYELTDFFQRQKAFYEYEKSVTPIGGKNENGEEVYGGVY